LSKRSHLTHSGCSLRSGLVETENKNESNQTTEQAKFSQIRPGLLVVRSLVNKSRKISLELSSRSIGVTYLLHREEIELFKKVLGKAAKR
jgi:hypothetical protein